MSKPKRKKRVSSLSTSKYFLYENSVQAPKTDAEWLGHIYQQTRGRPAHRLREDFCGTFATSFHWVKDQPGRSAVCLDLDPEPLEYGRANHLTRLTPAQRKRIQIMQRDVFEAPVLPASKAPELVFVGNFSFFFIQERAELRRYFKRVLKSLAPGGVLLLEMAGGPGMIRTCREQKTVPAGKHKYVYVWDQRAFDPIHSRGQYSIHFKFSDGTKINHAFTYDWRLWSIPEVREILKEAGFDETRTLWEASKGGAGTGEYVPMENGDNAYAWIAYVLGLKN